MSVYIINMPEDQDKKYQQFRYPAGEYQVRLLPSEIPTISEADKVVVIAHTADANLIPIALMLSAITGVNNLCDRVVVLPYLPYSRADRRFTEGDCLGKSILSDTLWMADSIVTFDVHSSKEERSPFVKIQNVDPMPIIRQVISAHVERPTILVPDKGARTRYDYESFQGAFPIAQCEKVRDPQTGKLSGFVVPPIPTQRAIVIDDLCDGGGTYVGIGEQVKKNQPEVRMSLYVSHGIFSQGFDKLRLYYDFIYTTDSYPGPTDPMVRRYPVDGMLKAAILSTEELFEQAKK